MLNSIQKLIDNFNLEHSEVMIQRTSEYTYKVMVWSDMHDWMDVLVFDKQEVEILKKDIFVYTSDWFDTMDTMREIISKLSQATEFDFVEEV